MLEEDVVLITISYCSNTAETSMLKKGKTMPSKQPPLLPVQEISRYSGVSVLKLLVPVPYSLLKIKTLARKKNDLKKEEWKSKVIVT